MLELITGRSGRAHIGSEDMRAYNAATFGSGRYALSDLTADVQNANTININPVELLVDGAHVRITAPGEVVSIESGIVGSKRMDIVALHYYVDDSDGNNIEMMELVVVKGEYSADSPSAPSMPTSGSILEGASDTHIPILAVVVDGLTPQTPTPLVSREDPISDKIMDVEKATGVLQPDHGGTGETDLTDAANVLIDALPINNATPTDNDNIVVQHEEDADASRRPLSYMWEYIKSKITGGISNVITSNFLASRAIVSNSDGKLVSSAVTSAEIGYLDGLKSNAQTQLDSKQNKAWTSIASVASGATVAFASLSNYSEILIVGTCGVSYTSSVVLRPANLSSSLKEVYLGGVWRSDYDRGAALGLTLTKATGYAFTVDGTSKDGTYYIYGR